MDTRSITEPNRAPLPQTPYSYPDQPENSETDHIGELLNRPWTPDHPAWEPGEMSKALEDQKNMDDMSIAAKKVIHANQLKEIEGLNLNPYVAYDKEGDPYISNGPGFDRLQFNYKATDNPAVKERAFQRYKEQDSRSAAKELNDKIVSDFVNNAVTNGIAHPEVMEQFQRRLKKLGINMDEAMKDPIIAQAVNSYNNPHEEGLGYSPSPFDIIPAAIGGLAAGRLALSGLSSLGGTAGNIAKMITHPFVDIGAGFGAGASGAATAATTIARGGSIIAAAKTLISDTRIQQAVGQIGNLMDENPFNNYTPHLSDLLKGSSVPMDRELGNDLARLYGKENPYKVYIELTQKYGASKINPFIDEDMHQAIQAMSPNRVIGESRPTAAGTLPAGRADTSIPTDEEFDKAAEEAAKARQAEIDASEREANKNLISTPQSPLYHPPKSYEPVTSPGAKKLPPHPEMPPPLTPAEKIYGRVNPKAKNVPPTRGEDTSGYGTYGKSLDVLEKKLAEKAPDPQAVKRILAQRDALEQALKGPNLDPDEVKDMVIRRDALTQALEAKSNIDPNQVKDILDQREALMENTFANQAPKPGDVSANQGIVDQRLALQAAKESGQLPMPLSRGAYEPNPPPAEPDLTPNAPSNPGTRKALLPGVHMMTQPVNPNEPTPPIGTKQTGVEAVPPEYRGMYGGAKVSLLGALAGGSAAAAAPIGNDDDDSPATRIAKGSLRFAIGAALGAAATSAGPALVRRLTDRLVYGVRSTGAAVQEAHNFFSSPIQVKNPEPVTLENIIQRGAANRKMGMLQGSAIRPSEVSPEVFNELLQGDVQYRRWLSKMYENTETVFAGVGKKEADTIGFMLRGDVNFDGSITQQGRANGITPDMVEINADTVQRTNAIRKALDTTFAASGMPVDKYRQNYFSAMSDSVKQRIDPRYDADRVGEVTSRFMNARPKDATYSKNLTVQDVLKKYFSGMGRVIFMSKPADNAMAILNGVDDGTGKLVGGITDQKLYDYTHKFIENTLGKGNVPGPLVQWLRSGIFAGAMQANLKPAIETLAQVRNQMGEGSLAGNLYGATKLFNGYQQARDAGALPGELMNDLPSSGTYGQRLWKATFGKAGAFLMQPFRIAELSLHVQGFHANYYDALQKGMSPEDAAQYAVSKISNTLFTTPIDRAPWMRDHPIAGALMDYSVQQSQFTAKKIAEGFQSAEGVKKLAQYLGTTALILGVTKYAFNNGDPWYESIAPLLGMTSRGVPANSAVRAGAAIIQAGSHRGQRQQEDLADAWNSAARLIPMYTALNNVATHWSLLTEGKSTEKSDRPLAARVLDAIKEIYHGAQLKQGAKDQVTEYRTQDLAGIADAVMRMMGFNTQRAETRRELHSALSDATSEMHDYKGIAVPKMPEENVMPPSSQPAETKDEMRYRKSPFFVKAKSKDALNAYRTARGGTE